MENKGHFVELNLFKETHFCKACENSWEGYSHGFSRGHLVLMRADKMLFVSEDIWYGFPPTVYFDLEDFFEESGWISILCCPICHSKRINEPKYEISEIVELKCQELRYTDLICIDGI